MVQHGKPAAEEFLGCGEAEVKIDIFPQSILRGMLNLRSQHQENVCR